MEKRILDSKGIRLLLVIGVVYFFLQYMTPLMAPFLIALLFVTMFGPLLLRMQSRLHIHRQIGACILLVLGCGFLGGLIWILISWGLGSLPGIADLLGSVQGQLEDTIHQICDVVGKAFSIDVEYPENAILQALDQGIEYLQRDCIPGILSHTMEYIRGILEVGAFLLTFVIASVLMAKEYDRVFNCLLDREECHLILEVLCGIIRYLATYIKAQVILMSIIGALSALVLGISGIKNGVLWGALAGFLDALPLIGTGIVIVPLAVQQLLLGRYGRMVICILLYIACILIREFLEPKLIGDKLGIPAIMILFSLYVGVKLFGGWGLIKGPLGFVIIYRLIQSMEKRLCAKENSLTKG